MRGSARRKSLRLLIPGLIGLGLLLALSPFPAAPSAAGQDAPDGQAEIKSEQAAAGARAVLWVRYEGVIGTVAASYILDALAEASLRDAECLVIELDTPGGLDTAMREIIKGILDSDAPVVVYVAPSGARAASAGAFIAIAAHVVAMAPGTNLGAAHPVQLGGGADSTLMTKATNDAAAYIRSLAKQRGRDADWAERAVRESVSADAEKALALGIADFVAAGREELLALLDGHSVETKGGERTLSLRDAATEDFAMSWRYRFLSLLNDPNVAYLLLLIGFYGIFFEFSSPGSILPGVIGGISLILALYALQSLSINYAGLLLMVLGLVFFVAELMTPTHGILTAGGITSLIFGSLMLFRSPLPFLKVSLTVILPAVGVTALFFIFAITMALRAQGRRPAIGRRSLVGTLGEARTDIDQRQGTVFVSGTHWEARADQSIEAGARVRVEAVEGLVLRVCRADSERKDD